MASLGKAVCHRLLNDKKRQDVCFQGTVSTDICEDHYHDALEIFFYPGRARRHWYFLCQHWWNLIEKKTVVLNRAPVKPLHHFSKAISKIENIRQVVSCRMGKTSVTGFQEEKCVEDECKWEENSVLVQVTGKQGGILDWIAYCHFSEVWWECSGVLWMNKSLSLIGQCLLNSDGTHLTDRRRVENRH